MVSLAAVVAMDVAAGCDAGDAVGELKSTNTGGAVLGCVARGVGAPVDGGGTMGKPVGRRVVLGRGVDRSDGRSVGCCVGRADGSGELADCTYTSLPPAAEGDAAAPSSLGARSALVKAGVG